MDVEELASRGRQHKACPYYATRHALPAADVILLPYTSLLTQVLLPIDRILDIYEGLDILPCLLLLSHYFYLERLAACKMLCCYVAKGALSAAAIIFLPGSLQSMQTFSIAFVLTIKVWLW